MVVLAVSALLALLCVIMYYTFDLLSYALTSAGAVITMLAALIMFLRYVCVIIVFPGSISLYKRYVWMQQNQTICLRLLFELRPLKTALKMLPSDSMRSNDLDTLQTAVYHANRV